MSTPVCTSFQKTDTTPTIQPIILPPFSAQNYAEYNFSWEVINTDPSNPLDATLEYYYYNSAGNILVLYSTTFQVAIGASEVNSVTQQFNGALYGNTIYSRISLNTSADVNVCVEEGEYIRSSCGSESYAFRDGDYWHIDNVFNAGVIDTSYSFAANALGTFEFFYFWDFDQGSPSGNENFTITISTVDTSGNITPVVLDNGTNQVSQDVNVLLAGQTQNSGTYNTTNIDYFFVEVDGTGPFGLGFRLVCPENEPQEVLESCCDWFANSTKSCYTYGGSGGDDGDLIAPSPISPELEHCAPVACNCIPVFIHPEDPTDSYKNDFSSFLFSTTADLTFTLQELQNGVWVDRAETPWDVFARGSFSEYPNRSGIIIHWVDLGETGTFRLKVGNDLFSLPHCVELYNCKKDTIRFTGEWTQNYTNYRFKGDSSQNQFVKFQDMPEPWPYQIRYHGTLGEFGIESEETDVITYYDDRNNLHYEKQKETIQGCIQNTILDLMQRHVYYVAKGSKITLDEYSTGSIDTQQYLRSYPVIFDNFDGVEYGTFNLHIPQFLVKYNKRYDHMIFSV